MTYQELNLGTPARYRIRVKGTLDASWSDRLGGISITTTGEGDEGSGWTLGVRPGFVREDGPGCRTTWPVAIGDDPGQTCISPGQQDCRHHSLAWDARKR